MAKVNCVIIWDRKALEIKACSISEDNHVNVTDSWQPTFALSDFIPETVTRKRFQLWKRNKGRQFLILKEGIENAIDPKSGKFDDHWTPKEAKKLIAKAVAKSAVTQKPFTNWQLIPILLLLGMNLVGLLLIINRIGL